MKEVVHSGKQGKDKRTVVRCVQLGLVGAVNDGEAKLGDNLALGGQLAGDRLPGEDTTNTGGCTGQDNVALLQLHDGRDVLDQ